ncbi:sugar ABC transporter substrate-binding protein [Streptomyces abyssalis]|uniref:Sugar ABC transporter substrate-binding protein n=1 Tax=Streptomyces abyssalis TaxID=933944 RepID=A0A1E7JIT0_9ACTN|nr:sugar ABC transporter substrate-binding protein [Streptomyces abyssalis]OEU93281.1 sugar ABC transporter substrate-binding protein [Streptomyces abyssalis]
MLAACTSQEEAPPEKKSIEVLMVDNPQMLELKKLTAEHFTKRTGIRVDFTTVPENEVREQVHKDFSAQSGRYDVATISNFETRDYARRGWLRPLDSFITKDRGFDQSDILLPIQLSLSGADGKVYAEPFYGESSFLMYRKDVFDELGLKMPEKPTWGQVASLAEEADRPEEGMSGICLRGQPGWGEMTAPLTTVVNTFGGTWFDQHWKAKLTDPGFADAAQFYVDLVRDHGEKNATKSGYAGCLRNMKNGRSAMWYDATAGAGPLEADGSPVKGKIGYVPAPVEETKSSGWLYTWAWGLQKSSEQPRSAWEFISWASSKEYEKLVGREIGWENVPAGKRESTFDRPQYKKAASAFGDATEKAIREADPRTPGVQRRPTVGIQFVGVPEFTGLGDSVSRELSAAIKGEQSVAAALRKSQDEARKVGAQYRKQP